MKNQVKFIKIFIYILFILGTVSVIWIMDRNFTWTSQFVIGYLILLLLMVIYFLFSTIQNLRKMKWYEVRKRLIIFVGIFLLCWVTNILFDYFTKGEVDIFYEMFIPLGVALGIAFIPKKW